MRTSPPFHARPKDRAQPGGCFYLDATRYHNQIVKDQPPQPLSGRRSNSCRRVAVPAIGHSLPCCKNASFAHPLVALKSSRRTAPAEIGQPQGERASLPILPGTVKGSIAFFSDRPPATASYPTGSRCPWWKLRGESGGHSVERGRNDSRRPPMWPTRTLVYRFHVGRQVGC